MTGSEVVTSDVTCLGCGCACDDIAIVVRDGRIAEARNACALGRAWFGDGVVPAAIRSRGRDVTPDQALDDAAALLAAARRALVYLLPGISCDAQRAAVALADRLHGAVDSVSSSTVAAGILAGQRRGRVAATLGELRNRADLVVFWGVDPAERYPRFAARYAPEPAGAFTPRGRASRTVVAVDIDDRTGPRDADRRVRIEGTRELDVIAAVRAAAAGRALGEPGGALATAGAELAQAFAAARYAAIIFDAEPAAAASADPGRAEALTLLAQSLSAASRCSLVTLRGGGNRNGADAVLTWQTGYPMAVDFSRGAPRYRPDEGAAVWLREGTVDAVLAVGDARAAALPPGAARRVLIGPSASGAEPAPEVAIDTGVAGIHSGGVAYRLDDVPLPLAAPLPGALDAASVVTALLQRVHP